MWSASSARPSAIASASARRRRPDSSNTPPLRTAPMTETRWLRRSWTKTVTWGSCMYERESRWRRSVSSSPGLFPDTGTLPSRGRTTVPGRETRTLMLDSSGTSNTTISIRSPGPRGRSAGAPAVADRRSSRLFRAALPALCWLGTPGAGAFASGPAASVDPGAPPGGCVTGASGETPPQAERKQPVRPSITSSRLTAVLCIAWGSTTRALDTNAHRDRIEKKTATPVPVCCRNGDVTFSRQRRRRAHACCDDRSREPRSRTATGVDFSPAASRSLDSLPANSSEGGLLSSSLSQS